MKFKLWTIQDEGGWDELQSKGVLVAREEFIDADFKSGYDWMKRQMNERIEYHSEDNQYPIWAWYQFVNIEKKRPDLRETGFLPKGVTGYRIELEKDAKDVLLSDFELWHTPLSFKSFIGNSELEALDFKKELLQEFGTDSFSALPDGVKAKIEKSWEKVFDMEFEVAYWAAPFEEKQIQATFWELNLDEIKKVDRFKAR